LQENAIQEQPRLLVTSPPAETERMIERDEVISALGAAARQIGESDFHLKLLELVGVLLPHQMSWIVRYAPDCDPEVLHTRDISATIVDYYLQTRPSWNDPYFCSWRTNTAPRVETMEAALPLALDRSFYALDFMKKMEFTDEVAIFLPSTGTSCLSLFVERQSDRFTDDDVTRLQRFFPAMLDFHRTHVRTVLTAMSGVAAGRPSLEDSPAAIFDRRGTLVFATDKWRALEQSEAAVRALRQSASRAEVRERADASPAPLNVVPLDGMNPLAPDGLLVHLTSDSAHAERRDDRSASSLIGRLTPRERDIVALTLDGLSTGAIAQQLGISKGSIKNCRLRIYRKLGVSSERALISIMMPFSGRVRAHLADGRR
jgi:DNA-binding CsgD family transcriptional regulator